MSRTWGTCPWCYIGIGSSRRPDKQKPARGHWCDAGLLLFAGAMSTMLYRLRSQHRINVVTLLDPTVRLCATTRCPPGGRAQQESRGRRFPGVAKVWWLQVVINNAGVLERGGIDDVTADSMLHCYQVNALGPIFVTQALLRHKLLKPGSLIANITSLVLPRPLFETQNFSSL
jgi:NAD(P)-dependent dehydrogenase (short-subunit alcohol dehydrogenase family)